MKNKPKYIRLGIKTILSIWILVSFAALVGMYQLWWQRERVLYGDKDVIEQRAAVFERAGLPAGILKTIGTIDKSWPLDIHYQVSGKPEILSYVTYLLIPRIPSGKGPLKLVAQDQVLQFDGEKNTAFSIRYFNENPTFRGLLFSFLLAIGVAAFLRKCFQPGVMGWVELFSLAMLLLMIFTVLSKVLFGTVNIGFWSYSAIGLFGWIFISFRFIPFLFDACPATFQPQSFIRLAKETLSASRKLFQEDQFKAAFLGLLVLIIILNFTWGLLMSVVVVPDDWDAWAIWGAKAKVLALDQGPLQNVTYFDHPDYPLLWPSVWAFSGWCAGGWEEQWSRGWGPIFMLLCAWEIFVILRRSTSRIDLGLLGAALFVSVPAIPLISSWSYAEAPLWLMMTCSFGCLLKWRATGEWQNVLFGGIFATAAAYTKNEGILFALSGLLWLLVVAKNRRLITVLIYCLSLTVLYLPWVLWVKGVLDLGSHATAGLNFDLVSLQRALSRMPLALDLFLRVWSDIRQWNVVLWGIGFISIYLLLRGDKSIRTNFIFPVLMLFGFVVIIVFHNEEIAWQIGTSWNRLTAQTIPLFLIATILGGWNKKNNYKTT